MNFLRRATPRHHRNRCINNSTGVLLPGRPRIRLELRAHIVHPILGRGETQHTVVLRHQDVEIRDDPLRVMARATWPCLWSYAHRHSVGWLAVDTPSLPRHENQMRAKRSKHRLSAPNAWFAYKTLTCLAREIMMRPFRMWRELVGAVAIDVEERVAGTFRKSLYKFESPFSTSNASARAIGLCHQCYR